MQPSPSPLQAQALKRLAAYTATAMIVLTCGVIGGYAFYEHRFAQNLAAQNAQLTAVVNSTRSELSDLTAKVNTLAARSEIQSVPAAPSIQPEQPAPARPAIAPHRRSEDTSFKKLQSEIDAQGKTIDAQGKTIDAQGKRIAETRDDLTSTRGDLTNTRTELTGSIAHTHDELVLLQKKGERAYYEFDIQKSKQFQREGPFGIRLKKANTKHQYADLELMVDDRNLSQKHVNLYQPVMFYTPGTPLPAEVVINNISDDHIHGYVSTSRYRQSELASMSNAGINPTPASGQATDSNTQASSRPKLTSPQ